MGNFDVTTPAGSDLLSQGDDKIRELKLAIRESLRAGAVAGDNIEGVEAIFPGSSPSSDPVYRYRGLKGSTGSRPTSGQYGLYFDTTRNVLQRDNGTTWDDIGSSIPAGTVMVFYQASAPVGWTAVSVNDKFLRVVTAGGTGGSTGGTVAASTSLAHTHTVENHTHSLPQIPLDYTINAIEKGTITEGSKVFGGTNDGDQIANPPNGSGSFPRWLKNRTKTDTSGGSLPATDSKLGVFAYADVVVASKD